MKRNRLDRFKSFGVEDLSSDTIDNKTINNVIENNDDAEDLISDIEKIKEENEAISLEAFNGIEGLKTALTKIPEFFSKVTGFITNKFTREDKETLRIYDKTLIKKFNNNVNYVAYSKMNVYKSVGQKVKTLELVNVLNETFNNVILPAVSVELLNAEKALAMYASDPYELKSVRQQNIVSKHLEDNYNKHLKLLTNCFDIKDRSSTELFGNLYDRMLDFDETVKLLNVVNKRTYDIKIDDVLNTSERINASVSSLINSIENKNSIVTVSPESIKTLTSTCYLIAALLEFYSVYLFKLRECSIAVEDTLKAIK